MIVVDSTTRRAAMLITPCVRRAPMLITPCSVCNWFLFCLGRVFGVPRVQRFGQWL